KIARKRPGAAGSERGVNEPSIHRDGVSLREGVRTLVHHPQQYDLGNAGQTASRRGTPIRAGESNYTEIGAEAGLLGALLWIAWNLSLFAGLVARRAAAVAAVFGAILVLAVQTDVIGDPWVGYCVWMLAGLGFAEVALPTDGDRPQSGHRARSPQGERPRPRDRVLP